MNVRKMSGFMGVSGAGVPARGNGKG
jgi:hypothetical protein